jgi:hypothetical protein
VQHASTVEAFSNDASDALYIPAPATTQMADARLDHIWIVDLVVQ